MHSNILDHRHVCISKGHSSLIYAVTPLSLEIRVKVSALVRSFSWDNFKRKPILNCSQLVKSILTRLQKRGIIGFENLKYQYAGRDHRKLNSVQLSKLTH